MSDEELEQLRAQLRQAQRRAAEAPNVRLAAECLVSCIEYVAMTDDWSAPKVAEVVCLARVLRAELGKLRGTDG